MSQRLVEERPEDAKMLNILAWRGKHRGKLPRELAVTEPNPAPAGD